jgi:hypothetical protein
MITAIITLAKDYSIILISSILNCQKTIPPTIHPNSIAVAIIFVVTVACCLQLNDKY